MSKKHKSILDRAKAEARSMRNEATIQATKAASAGGMGQLWKNYFDAIDKAVKEFKQARKKKKAKEKDKKLDATTVATPSYLSIKKKNG